MTDPLFEESDRFTAFPIDVRYRDIYSLYKEAESSFWTVEEVDLTEDIADWKKLNKDEQDFIKGVLAFFAASDIIVNKNLVRYFMNEIKVWEIQCWYGYQIMIENIHSMMYSKMIDTFVQDDQEKDRLFKAVEEIPSIQNKKKWFEQWTSSEENFASRLIVAGCMESIFFCSSFCAIFWLKKRGLMNGLCISNEFISRDESQHARLCCLLYLKLKDKLSVEKCHLIVKQSVELEKEFVKDCLKADLIGMNLVLMSEYVEYCADRFLTMLDYPKIWNTPNPFPWMEQLSVQEKTNFFESRVSAYNMGRQGSNFNPKDLSEDF